MRSIKDYLSALRLRVERIGTIYSGLKKATAGNRILADIFIAYALLERLLVHIVQDYNVAKSVFQAIYGSVELNFLKLADWSKLSGWEQEMFIHLSGFIRTNHGCSENQLHTQRYLYLVGLGKMHHRYVKPFEKLTEPEKEELTAWIRHVGDTVDYTETTPFPEQYSLQLPMSAEELIKELKGELFYLSKLINTPSFICEQDRASLYDAIQVINRGIQEFTNDNNKQEAA